MARYVTSTHGSARLAHIGYPLTACGLIFTSPHRASDNMPNDRRICRRCINEATSRGLITYDEAAALLRRTPDTTVRAVLAQIIAMLIDGAADREVAQRLGVSLRTVNRYTAAAMREAGARTRFQWGYKLGLAVS